MKKFNILILLTLLKIKADLSVYSKDLISKIGLETIPYEIMHYGKIPMGRTIIGTLMIPTLSNKKDSCSLFDHESNIPEDTGIAYITNIGDCNPVILSINAERVGAKFLILVNDNEKDNLIENVARARRINIPTLLINKNIGMKIMEFISKNKELPIFSFSKKVEKSDIVHFDLAMDVNNITGYKFLDSFQSYLEAFSSKLNFNFLFLNQNCKTKGVKCSQEEISEKCISKNELLCSLKNVKEDLYVEVLIDCSKEVGILKELIQVIRVFCEENITTDCINDNLDVNSQISLALKSCVKTNNFMLTNIEKNNEKVNKLITDFKDQPMAFINNKPYYGSLTPENIFETICKSFLKTPKNCFYIDSKYVHSEDIKKIRDKNFQKKSKFFIKIFIFILFLLCLVGILLYNVFTKSYKKVLDARLADMIKESVVNYRTMKDNE